MGGLAGEERAVVLLLIGLALAAGALLWWQGQSGGSGLAWGGALAGDAAPVGPGASGQEAGVSAPGVSAPAEGDPAGGGETGERTAKEVVIHVAGAVLRPGVYSLPEGSRVIDAVAAAGGPSGAADANAVNLARRVYDGERLYVPTRDETRRGDWGSDGGAGGGLPTGSGPGPGGKVNLNTATRAELEALPGIGPSLAGRIIDYRTRNGPFRTPEELMNVSGIGEKRFADLEGLITTD